MLDQIRDTFAEFRHERRRRILSRMARQLGEDVHQFWTRSRADTEAPRPDKP